MNAFTLIIRPEYLEICEGDHCAAAILDLFKRWSASKLKKKAAAWIYKSQPELRDDLMGLFGLNRVSAALLKLREWGYLKHRQNPKNRQDKTLQYQVDGEAIREVLTFLSGVSDFENDSSETQNEGGEALKLKSRTPDLSDEESMNQSLIPSGLSSDQSSSKPTHHPDDDDLAIFKGYEKRFGFIQSAQKTALRSYQSQIGSVKAIYEILERCAASQGRSWSYVLTALANAAPGEMGNQSQLSEGSDKAKFADDHSPAQDSRPPAAPPSVSPDAPTEPDIEPNTEPTPEPDASPDMNSPEAMAWKALEYQIDRVSFDTYLRGVTLKQVSDQTLIFSAPSKFTAETLQHRMYRAIRENLAWTLKVEPETLQLQFEYPAAKAKVA